MSELENMRKRAERAEEELAQLKQENEKFKQYYGLSREELVAKLKQVRELVSQDVKKMADQEAELKKKDAEIERNQEMIQEIRKQLVEVKKELMVSGTTLNSL